MKSFYIFIVVALLGLSSCKERYNPETTSINSNVLIVEGFINTGADSTFVKLSRSVILANKNLANPEVGATLTIETSANESRVLVEKGKGVYATSPLNFGLNKKYRLKIRTKNGSTYESDFVEATVSPQIDSVNYKVTPEGLQLYVNANDPTNKTRYYRWDYDETWIFYAKHFATQKWTGGPTAVFRDFSESVYKCWGNSNSSTIVIGSSVQLEKDVIYLAPLAQISSTSEKLSEKYSILVKQYALSKEAYEFWQNLKKNTEGLGSIFDVLPSQINGNIRNSGSTAEQVIGYISAGTSQKRRIFISKDALPNWIVKYPYDCGELDTVRLANQRSVFSTEYVPVTEVVDDMTGLVIAHTGAPRYCADCTVRGTVKRPSFWQ